MPLSAPMRGKDGTMLNEIHVPKDTLVLIAAYASNRSTALWGHDVKEWKPERWLAPLPDALIQAKIPGIYAHT